MMKKSIRLIVIAEFFRIVSQLNIKVLHFIASRVSELICLCSEYWRSFVGICMSLLRRRAIICRYHIVLTNAGARRAEQNNGK
jgi:hypothetical protein